MTHEEAIQAADATYAAAYAAAAAADDAAAYLAAAAADAADAAYEAYNIELDRINKEYPL